LLLGYVEFAAFLVLPGAAAIELLGVGRNLPFSAKAGLAFGLGSAFDVILLEVRTSGLSILGSAMRGIDPGLVLTVVLASVVLLALPVSLKRSSNFFDGFEKSDVPIFALVFGLGLLVYAHFLAYPIFPQFNSVDFVVHSQLASGIKSGAVTPGLPSFLYFGADLLLGASVAVMHGVPLAVTQKGMGVLLTLSPLVVYAAMMAVFESRLAGLVGAIVYVAGGFVWFDAVFGSGLYDNFLGEISILTLLICLSLVIREPGRRRNLIPWALAFVSGLYSHYSFLTILPPLVLLPALDYVAKRRLRFDLLVICLLPVVFFGLSFILLRSDTLSFLASLLSNRIGSPPILLTPLAMWFGDVPFLKYVAVEVFDQPSTLILLAFAALGSLIAIRRLGTLPVLVVVWSFVLYSGAELSAVSWRFSLEALLPLMMLSSFGSEWAFQRVRTISRAYVGRSQKLPRLRRLIGPLFLVIILVPLASNSWSAWMLADASNTSPLKPSSEPNVYQSMLWFGEHTPPGSLLISLTDQRFIWAAPLVERRSMYAPFASMNYILSAANSSRDTYVAITEVLDPQVPVKSDLGPFLNDSVFSLVYQNQDVWIFKVDATLQTPKG